MYVYMHVHVLVHIISTVHVYMCVHVHVHIVNLFKAHNYTKWSSDKN